MQTLQETYYKQICQRLRRQGQNRKWHEGWIDALVQLIKLCFVKQLLKLIRICPVVLLNWTKKTADLTAVFLSPLPRYLGSEKRPHYICINHKPGARFFQESPIDLERERKKSYKTMDVSFKFKSLLSPARHLSVTFQFSSLCASLSGSGRVRKKKHSSVWSGYYTKASFGTRSA